MAKISNEKKILIILVVFIIGLFIFQLFYNFDKRNEDIYVDSDNTEKIVDKKDLNEIQDRLDELDIDLDDIIKELDL